MRIFKAGERPSWIVSLIPFLFLVTALALVIKVFGTAALDGASQVALIFGAAVVVAISMIFYKIPWKVFEQSILDNVLTRVPGIGKKTAQQIFLELKYKLKPGDGPVSLSAPGSASPTSNVYRDALTGLANLGYDEDMAGPLLKEALAADPDLSVGEALRAALKALGKGKL